MNACPLCHGTDVALLYPSNRSGDPEAADFRCTSPRLALHPDIFRCRACTLVFNEPGDGSHDHLDEYARVEDPEYLEQEASRRATYERELDHLERLRTGRDLLDVGCHAGFFLGFARDRGWRVAGVEPSRWAAEHARAQGFEVFNGPVEAYETERRFDVVTLWDVLEHLVDPVSVLRHIRRLLKPDGLLVFATHNLDRLLPRLMRGRYPLFMEMHTVHLTDRSRDLLLRTAGYDLVEVHTHARAFRLGYFLSRMDRFAGPLARAAERTVDLLGGRERLLWIGFSGAETVAARPAAEPLPPPRLQRPGPGRSRGC